MKNTKTPYQPGSKTALIGSRASGHSGVSACSKTTTIAASPRSASNQARRRECSEAESTAVRGAETIRTS
ncbi:hypothetical protein ACIBQX_50470 [Nonomuraea sp. NPDC049714]|uniref:hypothetical protein n=1 Tax=Nonomuraea sp. NPDC049714 TaxID=3364357 RepID=UPI00379AE088